MSMADNHFDIMITLQCHVIGGILLPLGYEHRQGLVEINMQSSIAKWIPQNIVVNDDGLHSA